MTAYWIAHVTVSDPDAYAAYQAQVRKLPSTVEKDFEAAIAQPVKQLQKDKKALPNKKKEDEA